MSQAAEWRAAGLKIGFTCGAFDLLHAGHVDYLQKARELCDRLVVAVNSDASVRTYKDPLRPIITEQHRLFVIRSLSCVDGAILMNDARPARLIGILRPDVYIKGGDYQVHRLQSAQIVESYGGRCAVIPIRHEVSTSSIVEHIRSGPAYTSMTARSESVSGIVLLDRDGTLIANVPFLKDTSRVKLLEGVGKGLRLLQDCGFRLAVITNQQGLGLGYFNYDDFVAVNSEMLRQLGPFGVRISKFYFCPHSLADNCDCRKPGTKLLQLALAQFRCAPEECYVIGDSRSDLEAAQNCGCKGWLVQSNSQSREHTFSYVVEQILTARKVSFQI